MANQEFTLSPEERDFLVGLLETALKDARVEAHRTRAPSYREHVIQREEIIAGLLTKLGRLVK